MNIIEQVKFYKKVKPEVWEIVKRLQALRNNGKTENEIENIIDSLNLPIGLHLFIKGNYSNLMSAVIR